MGVPAEVNQCKVRGWSGIDQTVGKTRTDNTFKV